MTADRRTRRWPRETDRVVARRGGTSIVRTHHGLVMAAAGIDASNTGPGPWCCSRSTRTARPARLRERLRATDRAQRRRGRHRHRRPGLAQRPDRHRDRRGRAEVLDDHAGREDGYGNVLAVTAPAVADEVAAAADLVKGKLGRRARRRWCAAWPRWCCPPGEHGPARGALVRDEAHDMFGLGAREAVLAARHRRPGRARGFGAPAPAPTLAGDAGRGLVGPPPAGRGATSRRGPAPRSIVDRCPAPRRRARRSAGWRPGSRRPRSRWAGTPPAPSAGGRRHRRPRRAAVRRRRTP